MAHLIHLKDDPVDVGTTAGNVLTIAAGDMLSVQNIHISNRAITAKKVSLSLSATTGAEDLTKSLLDDFVIAPNSFIEFGAGMKLGNAAARFLVAITETAATVTIKVSGTTEPA